MAHWSDWSEQQVEAATSYTVASPGSYKAKITNIEAHLSKESNLRGYKITFEFDFVENGITKNIKIYDWWMLESADSTKLPSIIWRVKTLIASLGLNVSFKEAIEDTPEKQKEVLKLLAKKITTPLLRNMAENLTYYIDVSVEKNTWNGVTKEVNRFKGFVKMEGIENVQPNYTESKVREEAPF